MKHKVNYNKIFFFTFVFIIVKSNKTNDINYINYSQIKYIQSNNNLILNTNKCEHYISKKQEINNNCTIKNCFKCNEIGECIECKENFLLAKKRCYSTECSIFGFCKYCDDYDCLSCLKGYQLLYGTCDILDKESKRKRLIYISIITGLIIILLIAIIIFCIFRNKKNKKYNNFISEKIIRGKHLKSGSYVIVHHLKDDINNNSVENNNNISSFNKSSCSHSLNFEKKEKNKDNNKCILCNKKKIYSFADCGCALCYEHCMILKNEKMKINCPIHNIKLKKSYSIKLKKKSSLKGNAIEQLGQMICPLCKIYPATQSFNCGCNMKLCTKCFNDNIFVFKYNQCPGCGKPYNPKGK